MFSEGATERRFPAGSSSRTGADGTGEVQQPKGNFDFVAAYTRIKKLHCHKKIKRICVRHLWYKSAYETHSSLLIVKKIHSKWAVHWMEE